MSLRLESFCVIEKLKLFYLISGTSKTICFIFLNGVKHIQSSLKGHTHSENMAISFVPEYLLFSQYLILQYIFYSMAIFILMSWWLLLHICQELNCVSPSLSGYDDTHELVTLLTNSFCCFYFYASGFTDIGKLCFSKAPYWACSWCEIIQL